MMFAHHFIYLPVLFPDFLLRVSVACSCSTTEQILSCLEHLLRLPQPGISPSFSMFECRQELASLMCFILASTCLFHYKDVESQVNRTLLSSCLYLECLFQSPMLNFGQFVINYMNSAEFPHVSNNRVKQHNCSNPVCLDAI